MTKIPIPAEIHTDDGSLSVEFDASKWFATASDDDIENVAGEDWGHGYAADGIARDLENSNEDIATVLRACAIRHKMGEEDCGFEVEVDAKAALKWLKKNRPALHKKIVEVPPGAGV